MQSLDDPKINSLIKDKYARNYNPARFALLQHLYIKATTPEHSHNKFITEKAHTSIAQYQIDLEMAREKSKLTVDNIKDNFSEHTEKAITLFAQCQFNQLERLNTRLTVNLKSYSELVSLITEIHNNDKADDNVASAGSIAALIVDQEQQARNRVGAVPYTSSDDSKDEVQLKSLIATRESMKHFNIDKMIERAIESCPENAGPHNPHMLTITSLMKLRDLSPQYLRRFASYIETILWLEKNEAKLKRKA